MSDLDNTIPTLVNVKQHGKKEMLNQFKTDSNKPTTDALNDLPEEDDDDNKTRPRNVQHDIPSIFAETSNDVDVPDIDTRDFSDAMQSIYSQAVDNTLEGDDLKTQIDHAINKALKDIEIHLKKQLYTKFGV